MYKKVDVSERELEELVRLHAHLIEEGLTYVTHQSHTPTGRLDVLLVDSGKSLVVAELKVVEDDAMLTQCLDYFDHVLGGIETYARMHTGHGIDPDQALRMLLVAPSFSQTLVNRCKYLDIKISLFTYSCLRFDGQQSLVPVFNEHTIPSLQEALVVHKEEDRLAYITDPIAKARAASVLGWFRETWGPRAAVDPIKDAISLKVDNRVAAYLGPRRKSFVIHTYSSDDKWAPYAINGDEELDAVKRLIQDYVSRRQP
jgi:hypothetical protein